jgi:hypothetical protein
VADLGAGAVDVVDRSTGAVSLLSSGGYLYHPSGVAAYVPEPASLASVAGVALIMANARRRRRLGT